MSGETFRTSKISSHNFYSFRQLLSYNAVYNFVVGGRGIGKTYGAKKLVIGDGIHKDMHFAYVRRTKEELSEAKATFFSKIVDEFPGYEFRVNGKYAEYTDALPDDFAEMPEQLQKQHMKKRKWVRIGVFIALTQAQNFKGSDFPRVRTILFDEFIIEKGWRRYLPDEVKTFNNLYSTIDRYSDSVRVLFLANSVAIDNPYFVGLDITPDDAKNGFIVRNKGFVAVHFPDDEDFKSEVFRTRFGQFLAETDPEYVDYAIGNQFSDNHKLLIDVKDRHADCLFILETERGTYSVWSKFMSDTMYIQAKLPKDRPRFTLLLNKVTEDNIYLPQNSPVLQGLRSSWRTGKVRFDTPKTRNGMLEIFK